MSALIWKELRENIKWALLFAFLLGGAEFMGLGYTTGREDNYYNDREGLTLLRPAFLTVTTFGCAFVGLIFGLVQILPELRRDRWAALLHRPVSRGVILRGKVVAGLVLYLLATVPPFLWCVWWVSVPGHFNAPFVPGMVLAGTADICAGLVYYFAALVMTLQRGGWIGLRCLPPLAAIYVSSFVLNVEYFYVAIEATVLMAVALFTAAWGAIYDQDLFGERPWLGRGAFLAVNFYGVCGLGTLTGTFLISLGGSVDNMVQIYELSDNGVPLLLTYNKNILTAVSDLDGHQPTDANQQPDRLRNHTKYLSSVSDYIGDSHGYESPTYRYGYRKTELYLSSSYPYSYPRLEQWFSLAEPHVMIGYLPDLKLPFAWFDANGFEPLSANPVAFPPSLQTDSMGYDSLVLWDVAGARIISLSRRTLTPVVLPEPSPFYGLSLVSASDRGSRVNAS